MLGSNILFIIVAFVVASTAIYALYSIILFPGVSKGDELQLTTKNILEQVSILFDKHEYSLVELLATKYLDRVPGHLDVRRYLAKAYYENRKYNLAIKQCNIILAKRPYDADTRNVLGKCYQMKQIYTKAIKEFAFVYDRNKKDAVVLRTLAELYVKTDQLYMAITSYGELVNLLTVPEEQADVYSIIADLNEEIYDYPAAFEAYKARLSIYPKDVETNKKLTELYVKISNYPVAIETLLFMLSFVTDPKMLLWIYELLVELYETTEDFEKAVAYSEKLLEVQGSDKFKVRERIAEFNMKLSKIDEGIIIFEDLAMLSQNAFDITIKLADAYIQKGDFQNALDRYMVLLDKATPKEAKTINTLICVLYIRWSEIATEAGDFDTAYERLNNAMQYNTINPEVYYHLAYNMYIQKNYTGTVENANKALSYEKDKNAYPKFLLLLAKAHRELGNFFEEKKALTDLLNINDKNAEGLYRIGTLYISQHDVKSAEEAFKKALNEEPDMIQAKYNLAILYESSNRDKAKELYMEILEQDPTFIEAKNALTDLSSTDSF